MDLGRFSVSLAVKDIEASTDFYTKLGFTLYDDHREENWAILVKDHASIGLFQGMFENNIMTFNPTDVRSIQKNLKEKGIDLDAEADENTSGPAHIMLTDPDGNAIMIDQHDPDYKPTST